MTRHSNKTNFPYVELSKLYALQAVAYGFGVATSDSHNVDVQGIGFCDDKQVEEATKIVQNFVSEEFDKAPPKSK